MENIRNNFKEFYKDKMYDDKQKIKEILDEVKKYDIYDFLAKISALNLVPENQNKATILEPITAAILTLNKKECVSEYKISMGKFKKIVKMVENLQIKHAIDPPENTFIDRVMFYGNYNIFNGISNIPAEVLQSFIETIYLQNNGFNINFCKKASLLINFVLNISDSISRRIDIELDSLKKYDELSEILIPSSEQLEIKKECLVWNKNIIERMLPDEEIRNTIFSDFNNEKIEDILNIENQKFFIKPFLKDNKENIIVLSPSILVPFLIHNIIILSDKFNEKERLIQYYNNTVWKKSLRYFKRLKNKKIDEKSLKIDLESKGDFYKEAILSGDNKQVVVAIGVFDDGLQFDKKNIFGEYKNNKINGLLEKRIEYFTKNLKKSKIEQQNIYYCIIISTFGRSISIGLKSVPQNVPITLNPFELKCISINECEQKFFITRYINAKNKIIRMPEFFGELPYIDVYTNSNYSFYVSDDVSPQKSILYLTAGDYIEYIIKALKKEDRHLVDSYEDGFLNEVIVQDANRKIYVSEGIQSEEIVVSFLNEFKNFRVWIYSNCIKDQKELNIYHSMIDAISYWFGELKELISDIEKNTSKINIRIIITGNSEEYFYAKNYSESIIDTINFKKNNNEWNLSITPQTFYCFNRNDNFCEKELIKFLMKNIFKINHHIMDEVDKKFLPIKKQKFFALDYQTYPYLKPIIYFQNRRINENDVNELLDEVGQYILSIGKWKYGTIKDEDRSEITKLIVDYLYKKLEQEIIKLNPHNLLELIYNDLEETTYYMMMFQIRQYSDTLCYPEKKNDLWNDFNKIQRVSKALKFLIEYVAAQPPSGNQFIGEYEYEKILAVCSLIIEWAYNNDLFKYNMFNTPIEILKSDRVGMKREEFNIMGNSMINARTKEYEYRSIGKWNEFIIDNKFNSEELDKAFECEKKFTFTEFLKVCYQLILIGEEQESEIKREKYDLLINKLGNDLKDVKNDNIKKIIDYISLRERNNFLIPPEGFRKEDVYPWRFNREISFTRRPVIIRKEEILWGNRNLFHMTMFLLDLIYDGKFKSRSTLMNKYIGKISKERGKAFNESIYNILKTFKDLIVDKNLKKINGKKIADENNMDLGDIDILYISRAHKIIAVGEVKDFKLSKNPYEIYCEYLEMFNDDGKKKSYSTKLHRRCEWVKNHIEDVKKQYNLSGNNWNVYKVFIVNEHILSNNVYKKDENIISISEINLKNLVNLK